MATTHTTAEVIEATDLRAGAIANHIAREMELTIAKVAAHHADPAKFPLPAQRDALEHVIVKRVGRLPQANRQVAVDRFRKLGTKLAAGQPAIGGKPAVAFDSPIPMIDQVRQLPLPARLAALMAAPAAPGEANPILAAAAAPPLDKLEFRVHSVKCVDETGRSLPLIGEPGSDEISLGGTTVDETGDTKKVADFKVGDFDDGDVKDFAPSKRFTMFSLREGPSFPKSYFVTLVLAEKDFGAGLNDFLNELQKKVEAKVREYVLKHGPVGIAVGEVVVLVVGKVFDLMRSWFADDIFPPVTLKATIASLNHRFASGNTHSRDATATFKGHNGHYQVAYDWRVFA